MKQIAQKAAAVAAAVVCLLSLPIPRTEAVSQGTKGDELQIMQAQQLEIRLGPEWAGTEFVLETDAGKYPGTVIVGPEGVLRMEVGGSSKYILTRVYADIGEPSLHMESEPSTTASQEEERETEPGGETESAPGEEQASADIPALPLALFGGGMIAVVGTLIWISVWKRRHRKPSEEDEIL